MRTYRVRHAHFSQWHSTPAGQVGPYVAKVVFTEGVSAFTTTETHAAQHRAIKHALGPAFAVRRAGEYLIGVDRSVYRYAPFADVYARFSMAYNGDLSWRDFYAHRRVYRHRDTGRLVLIGAGHAPASVERGNVWNLDNRDGVAASRAGFARLGAWIARARRRWADLIVAFGFDTNLDHHRETWRTFVGTSLDLHSMWDRRRPAPGVGTLGARLVDAIYSNAEMRNPHITDVPKPGTDDHRDVIVTLLIPEVPGA